MHSRLADDLYAHLAGRMPHVTIEVVRDDRRDPPHAAEHDILVANTFPPGMLARCRRLRWLQLTGTGADHLAAGRPRPDLLVTHAGGIPSRAVAEFVLMGMFVLAKDAMALVRRHDAREWRLPDARLLGGSTLVQLGLGRIGSEIARRARALDVRVIAVTRTGRPNPRGVADLTVPAAELTSVARSADHLVVAVPGTEQTRGLVSAEVMAALPENACLINVARSSVVDTAALVAVLRDGRLRGALLDVHDEEPLLPDNPLWRTDRLWVTPHAAFCYPGEAADLAELIVDNFRRLSAGAPLRNIVDLTSA